MAYSLSDIANFEYEDPRYKESFNSMREAWFRAYKNSLNKTIENERLSISLSFALEDIEQLKSEIKSLKIKLSHRDRKIKRLESSGN